MKSNPAFDILKPQEAILEIKLKGVWTKNQKPVHVAEIIKQLKQGDIRQVCFDSQELAEWDSLLLCFLIKIIDFCKKSAIQIDQEKLPEGVKGLLKLAYAVPEKKQAHPARTQTSLLAQIGKLSLAAYRESLQILGFVGEVVLAFMNLTWGQARFRSVDLWLAIQESGPKALPIVSLISLLVGLILAFVGAVQLQLFGAQIFIADLVGLGMSREMGAMMTAIIMAGRTGAAYAAQLGSMQVNEEIDALKTMGFSPMEFLVLPRMIALILMMPLLCLYADFMGILGGALVSISLFDISFLQYFHQTQLRLHMGDFMVGLSKSAVFGVLVAIAGCMRGLQCGRSSSAVGFAATSAVVTGIVFIIVSDAIMTLIITSLQL